MLKKALIVPLAQLELAKEGDIHMVLTHLVHTNEEYADFYAKEKKYKILDNSAFEGQLQSIEKVCGAAARVNADEIILPDIVYDGSATIKAAKASLEYLDSESNLTVKTMAVVQGSSEQEWWDCYSELAAMKGVDVIGFSKLSCPRCFGFPISEARMQIVRTLEEENEWPEGKAIHLLGGSYHVVDEIKFMSKYEQIRSIDTSAPVEYGKRRIVFGKRESATEEPAHLDRPIRAYNAPTVKTNVKLFLEAGRDNKS